MRWLLALLALLGVATAASARDWTLVARPAPQGSYVIGNPKARVKLVEFASYTCPHCKHFADQSGPVLKAMIRSGSTSLEIRSAIHDKIDIVAALLARCSRAGVFPRFHDALFARQDDWLGKGADWDVANGRRYALYSQTAQIRAIADASGLADLARASGMSGAAVDTCLADQAQLKRALDVADAAAQTANGTPAFLLNGKLIERVDWAKLEPQLRAAGAK